MLSPILDVVDVNPCKLFCKLSVTLISTDIYNLTSDILKSVFLFTSIFKPLNIATFDIFR